MYSVCKESHIRWITWDDDAVMNTDQGTTSHMRSFLAFLDVAEHSSTLSASSSFTDSIHNSDRQLVVIDLLPTSLIPSASFSSQTRTDRYATATALTA